jgi:hypothetical protein
MMLLVILYKYIYYNYIYYTYIYYYSILYIYVYCSTISVLLLLFLELLYYG